MRAVAGGMGSRMSLGCYSDFQSRVPEDVSLDFTKIRSLIKKHLLLR